MHLSLVDGHYRDGTKALLGNGDNVQVKAILDKDAEAEGKKVYIPVVQLDVNSELISLLEENNLLLKVMVAHLKNLTGAEISEEDADEGEF